MRTVEWGKVGGGEGRLLFFCNPKPPLILTKSPVNFEVSNPKPGFLLASIWPLGKEAPIKTSTRFTQQGEAKQFEHVNTHLNFAPLTKAMVQRAPWPDEMQSKKVGGEACFCANGKQGPLKPCSSRLGFSENHIFRFSFASLTWIWRLSRSRNPNFIRGQRAAWQPLVATQIMWVLPVHLMALWLQDREWHLKSSSLRGCPMPGESCLLGGILCLVGFSKESKRSPHLKKLLPFSW